MTTQLPDPTLRALQIVYYPAKWQADGDDANALPDLVTQTATVTITPTAPAHRLPGTPARMVDSLAGTWTVAASGELRDSQDRLGVWVPDPAATGVDYTFRITHASGVTLSGTVTGGTPLPDTVNLADYVSVIGRPVATTIEQRMAAIETAIGAPGGAAPDATESTRGWVQLATAEAAVEGTDSTKAITPASLAAALDARPSGGVTTVNGHSGDVQITAESLGALTQEDLLAALDLTHLVTDTDPRLTDARPPLAHQHPELEALPDPDTIARQGPGVQATFWGVWQEGDPDVTPSGPGQHWRLRVTP